jgi:hypothetical protein
MDVARQFLGNLMILISWVFPRLRGNDRWSAQKPPEKQEPDESRLVEFSIKYWLQEDYCKITNRSEKAWITRAGDAFLRRPASISSAARSDGHSNQWRRLL